MLQELRRVEELIEEGDLVAAQRACKRLLQQHPTNAAVHEAMGDVMRRREMWEDAAEWYDLAAQLQETEALKAKRADVLQRAKESSRGGAEPHLVDDADSPRRLMVWLGIAAAAMLIVAIGVVWSIAQRHDDAPRRVVTRTFDRDAPSPIARPGVSTPSPVRGTRDAPAPSARPQGLPRATAVPEQHWAATELPRRAPRREVTPRATSGISPSAPDPMTDHDQAVVNAVSSLTWGDNRPMTGRVNAMVEPYSGYAMISVTIPQAIPDGGLADEVVRQAWRVAVAATRAEEVISSLTIRMIRVTDQGERVVAFRGNTTRRALQNVGERPDAYTLWNQVFAATWWNPQVSGDMPSIGGSGANDGA